MINNFKSCIYKALESIMTSESILSLITLLMFLNGFILDGYK